ncbi:MAG: hypothetical protein BWY96_03074 [Spirochaetes bacterium ADurb.BinA120]|nr:MAG: hypothetical protein BWY96_03074 [Spirochaetes bacterium ADurb.BinA120]
MKSARSVAPGRARDNGPSVERCGHAVSQHIIFPGLSGDEPLAEPPLVGAAVVSFEHIDGAAGSVMARGAGGDTVSVRGERDGVAEVVTRQRVRVDRAGKKGHRLPGPSGEAVYIHGAPVLVVRRDADDHGGAVGRYADGASEAPVTRAVDGGDAIDELDGVVHSYGFVIRASEFGFDGFSPVAVGEHP